MTDRAATGISIACWALCAAMLLAGCQREDKDAPLVVAGRLVVFNYRVAKASYLVTLRRQGDVPEGSIVETRFENPAGGAPLVTRDKIFASEHNVVLESPDLHCVVKDRPYTVDIRVSDPKGNLIQTLQTTVKSSEDQSILPAKPLVLGAVYTKNPEVFKADGSTDFSPEAGCRP